MAKIGTVWDETGRVAELAIELRDSHSYESSGDFGSAAKLADQIRDMATQLALDYGALDAALKSTRGKKA